MEAKKHYPFLDKLWLFSVCFIVWFHTPPRFDRGTDLAFWYIGLSFFFFTSGCLFNAENSSLKSFFKKKFRRLVWPALVCYLGFYLLWLVFGRYHAGVEDLEARWYDPLIELVIGDLELVAVPLWFVYALMLIQSTTILLMKKGSYPLLCVVSLFFFLISPWVEFHYYYIHFAIRFYIWHTLGVWLRAKWIQKTWQSGSPTPWISSIKEVGIVILAAQNYVIGCH